MKMLVHSQGRPQSLSDPVLQAFFFSSVSLNSYFYKHLESPVLNSMKYVSFSGLFRRKWTLYWCIYLRHKLKVWNKYIPDDRHLEVFPEK